MPLRSFLFCIAFLLWVSTCVAQDKSPSTPPPVPKEWEEFSSPDGRFSVLFFGQPNRSSQSIELAPAVQVTLVIHNVKQPAEHSVMYADYPIPVGDPRVAKGVLDDGAQGAVASVNSELLELKEITLQGYPGRYLHERMPSGEIMRVKMILVGQRLYQVAITTPAEEGAAAETVKMHQAMAEKFLDSFKLLKSDPKSPKP